MSSTDPVPPKSTRIAVWGCGHGELERVYDAVAALQARADPGAGPPVSLLICCGDFQATRNEGDLECMSCPPKYRAMQSFYKYYSGEKVRP
jgi:lariat debranching enzyme